MNPAASDHLRALLDRIPVTQLDTVFTRCL